MNRAQDSRKPTFSFRSTLRKMLPKGSSMPSEIAAALNNFEGSLEGRIHKLQPIGSSECFLTLSWMTNAMEQLSAIHADIENLSAAIDHPIHNWKDKWMHMYFEDSAKMLEILNPFISHIRALEQSQLYFDCALQHMQKGTQEASPKALFSLDKWTEAVDVKDPSLQRSSAVSDAFLRTLSVSLPKTSNDKEKVLVRAMYGFKVVAVFVCDVFAKIFSGSVEKAAEVKVADEHLWADAFVDLQASVNDEMRRMQSNGEVIAMKEVKVLVEWVEKVCPLLRGGEGAACLVNLACDLGESAEECFRGIALLSKEIDRFFKAILSGRNTLMGRAQHCLFPRGERRG